jgi:hypothetical protein
MEWNPFLEKPRQQKPLPGNDPMKFKHSSHSQPSLWNHYGGKSILHTHQHERNVPHYPNGDEVISI